MLPRTSLARNLLFKVQRSQWRVLVGGGWKGLICIWKKTLESGIKSEN